MEERLRSVNRLKYIFFAYAVSIMVITLFATAVAAGGWEWTGFIGGKGKVTTTMTTSGTTTGAPGTSVSTEQLPTKTLWDVLELLSALAIPVAVGIGAAWFSARQDKVSARENKDNQREAALQAYIDKISELLLKEHLGERTARGKLKPQYEQVRNVARVRTITVLSQLDGSRVSYVFTFLREAGLMSTTSDSSVVGLKAADLNKVRWERVMLDEADLSETNLIYAHLSAAYLKKTNLSKANLGFADLSYADLSEAILSGAIGTEVDLSEANLSGANLSEASLLFANLRKANLSGANLSKANLHFADLRKANLSGAIGTNTEQLEKAKSLKGAIMPDGSKHPRTTLRDIKVYLYPIIDYFQNTRDGTPLDDH